jgi:hypothetical protein
MQIGMALKKGRKPNKTNQQANLAKLEIQQELPEDWS